MTKQELIQYAESKGLTVRTYSPGDGVTRYRFFTDASNGYFGPSSGIYTALGRKEATAFIEGYVVGKTSTR